MNEQIKVIWFSFFILEYAGGCEEEMIESATNIHKHSQSISPSIVTATPKLTKWLYILVSIAFLKNPDTSSLFRESTEKVRKRLGNVNYTQFNSLSRLAKILNTGDVLYVKNEVLELVIMKLLRKKLRSPMIIKVATPIYYPYAPSLKDKAHNLLYTGRFYKWLIKDAVAFKVNTASDKEYLEEKFEMNNAWVIHNAFEVQEGRQIQNNDHRLRILYVGRITVPKGIDILIATIKQLQKDGRLDDVCFRIVGGGEESLIDQLKELASLYDNVEYLGYIESNKVAPLYDWADVVMAPSYYETLNRVVAECAVAAKVAICTDIPGPRAIVENNVTGYLLPAQTAAFVDKINDLVTLKNKKRAAFYSMGVLAQEKIAKEFSSEKVYSDLCELYLSVGKVSHNQI